MFDVNIRRLHKQVMPMQVTVGEPNKRVILLVCASGTSGVDVHLAAEEAAAAAAGAEALQWIAADSQSLIVFRQ